MAALEHGSFLEKLNEKFRVFLVNRYADPRMGFGGDGALRVFMPDLHWNPVRRAEKYHWPRILVDRHPAGGGPLVTMDCGAWIENCTIQGAYQQPSHSIGVQCGNEVRVYQLAAR
jgi:hypothetical protein